MELPSISEILKKPEVMAAAAGGIIGLAISIYGSDITDALANLNTTSDTTETTGIDQEWCIELYDAQSCN